MLKVAILDDYQNVAQEFVDLKKLSGKYEFKVFSEPFFDEADAIEKLAELDLGTLSKGPRNGKLFKAEKSWPTS